MSKFDAAVPGNELYPAQLFIRELNGEYEVYNTREEMLYGEMDGQLVATYELVAVNKFKTVAKFE